MHEDPYKDLFTINVTNSVAGDPTQIFFNSTEEGHYLLCMMNCLCEAVQTSDVLKVALASLSKMQLRPAVQGNHYCFHIYSQLPVCLDEETGCLVHAQPKPGCEPAVFALQTASSALLLQEIIELTRQCAEKRSGFTALNKLLHLRQAQCKGTPQEFSAELQEQVNRRDKEEEKLVFLEDNLSFVREQLNDLLLDAGPDAAHGLPEACMPDFEDALSCKPESRKATFKHDSGADISPVAKVLRLASLEGLRLL